MIPVLLIGIPLARWFIMGVSYITRETILAVKEDPNNLWWVSILIGIILLVLFSWLINDDNDGEEDEDPSGF